MKIVIKKKAPKPKSTNPNKDEDDQSKKLRFQKPAMVRNVPIIVKYEKSFFF